MSEPSETQLGALQGKHLQAIRDGTELKDATWEDSRVIVTSERLVLDGEETVAIALAEIDEIGGRFDVNQAVSAESSYTTIYRNGDAWLVSARDQNSFRLTLYRALLDGSVIYVKYPAVLGGVVQSGSWQRGRVAISQEAVRMQLEDGQQVTVDRADIGEFERDTRSVAGEQRTVLEVEHTDEDNQSVQTYISGRSRHISVLKDIFEADADQNRTALDLTETERRVVMALHSGVSPLGISEFVGIDVERVEEIYDRLIERDVIEVVRKRKDVSLTALGRKVASEKMSNQ